MITRDVFGRETVPVVTTAEAAEHDQAARSVFSIPERVLMENAGRALALITNVLYPAGTIVGVAGSGHNGGDTVVALRTLRGWGRDVAVISLSSKDLDRELLHGAELQPASDDDVPVILATAAVILDGILGTGARGAPRSRAVDMIRAINTAGRPVVAVDIPSGIDADSGSVFADAVRAVVTVTLGFPKIGLLFHPARGCCGRLIAVDIALPPLQKYSAEMITPKWASARVPRRTPTANKGTSGRLLLVAGSDGMAGAAVLAGRAAVHSGAGIVRIASVADNREILQKSVPEATFFARDGEIGYDGVTAVVAGPGMGATESTRATLRTVFENTEGIPLLLDADGLNVFSDDVDAIAAIAHARPVLLTPHAKEMSRLTGATVSSILADPPAHARALAERLGVAVLLKGQPSIVASGGAPLLINSVGSSDFAVAGMGDQLAGVAGSMLAGGADPRTAAALGLFYGGRAGDIAGLGRSLTPTDVIEYLPRAFAQPGPAASPLGFPFITFDQPARW